ncbi:hypothetical protein [Shewanella cutis]|uniref:Uncharacterized protein n=1 Tax=Shewanella cutis TaxID=2766780 RepID=A0ABS9QWB4_9GAMM|nr:hypothetical protein [Shewanella sp. PS-2]MCG9964594.1 hypothetical protein [Shewanella sp. PS-2]
MSWQELAYKIDDAETLISFTLLCISFFLYRVTSTNISLAIWVLANFVMERLAEVMLDVAKTDTELIRQLWYLSFVIIDTICVWSIYLSHRKLRISFDKFSVFICFSFTTMAVIQLVRYTDRIIFETEYFAVIYKYGILSLSMAPMVLMALMLSFSIINFRHAQE